MQFLIDRDNLLEVLTKLASIIDSKAGIPILKNVFMDVRGTMILLRSTDVDLQLTIPCPAEVTEQGQFTVDGRLLHDIVRKCPKAGQIGFTLGGKPRRRKAAIDDADRLLVTSGRAEFTLNTLPADDWPIMALPAGAAEYRLECRQFRTLIEKTRFAISTDETRYYLNGIYLHVLGEQLAAVATDGHRLALKTMPLPAGADDMPAPQEDDDGAKPRTKDDGKSTMRGVIIPRDAASAALKILPDSEIECEFACSANLLSLRVGEVEMISKLIDGTYPDYLRVIPSRSAARMIAPREALAQAVSRVGVVLEARDHAIRIGFEAEQIKLTAHSHTSGHFARENVEDCVCEGGALEVGLNPRYLAELLEAMDGTQLAIILQDDPASPLLFEEVDGDGSVRMILMPMRVPVAGMMPGDEPKKKAA
jgi:DNA polymerase-3 subunit beta